MQKKPRTFQYVEKKIFSCFNFKVKLFENYPCISVGKNPLRIKKVT